MHDGTVNTYVMPISVQFIIKIQTNSVIQINSTLLMLCYCYCCYLWRRDPMTLRTLSSFVLLFVCYYGYNYRYQYSMLALRYIYSMYVRRISQNRHWNQHWYCIFSSMWCLEIQNWRHCGVTSKISIVYHGQELISRPPTAMDGYCVPLIVNRLKVLVKARGLHGYCHLDQYDDNLGNNNRAPLYNLIRLLLLLSHLWRHLWKENTCLIQIYHSRSIITSGWFVII